MQDEDEAKEQLITELHALRQRLAESEKDKAERKRAEEALLEFESKFKSFTEQALAGVYILYQVAFKLVPKEAEKLGELCPRTPSQLRCSMWRCSGRPASAGQPPPAPSAWPRAQTRAAKSCGVRGSHFPALFDYFNLERKLVLQDGVFKYVNAKFAQMFGYTVEECLNEMPFQNLVYAEDLATVEEQVRRRVSGEAESVHYTFRGLKKNGQIFHVEVYGATSIYKGEPAGAGTILDITERRQAQDELFNSRQMLRSVLDNIQQRVFWKDRNSVYVGCDKLFVLDLGYEDPSELVGKTDYEHASAATADLYRADDREVMESGRAKINYEEPQIRPDGSRAWLITSKVPMFDQDAQVIGVLGTYSDITERKLMEQEISQTNAYLENMFENSPEAIAITDNNGRFIRWNKMAEDLYGYTFEEMKGKSAFDLYADKDELEKVLMSLGREGSVKKWEMRMERKDGSIVPFEISIGLLKDSQNKTLGIISVARDLSGIKETLAALRASNDQLNQEII